MTESTRPRAIKRAGGLLRAAVGILLLSAGTLPALAQAGKKPPARPAGKSPTAAPTITITPSQPVPAAAPRPDPKLAWTEPFPAEGARLALADLAGMGRDQVVTLTFRGQQQWSLTIHSWSQGKFERLWSVDLELEQPLLAAGRFVKGEAKGQAVVPTGAVVHDTSGYRFVPFEEPCLPVGQLRRADGTDTLLLRVGAGFQEAALARGPDGDLRVASEEDGRGLKEVPDILFGVVHGSEESLEAALPKEYAANGVLGLWAVMQKRPALRFALGAEEKAGAASSWLALAESFAKDALKGALRVPLEGPGADVAVGDPKGEGRPGLVVLGARAGGRFLAFFAPAAPEAAAPGMPQRGTGG